MVGRILLQCCWNIMRSSQVLGSEGGEEGREGVQGECTPVTG